MRIFLFTMLAVLVTCCSKNSLNTNPEQNFEWVALADKIYDI